MTTLGKAAPLRSAAQHAAALIGNSAGGGTRTGLTKAGVLLVEADGGLERSLRAVLQAEDYEVLTAARWDDAPALIEGASIDILVVDTDGSPGSVGPLLAQFRAKRPQLGMIAIRGPGNQAAHPDSTGVDVWLEKPLQPPTLAATVNNLLAALRAEVFRENLLRRHAVPFLGAQSSRHWGINE